MERNWKKKVRQEIYAVGNVGEPFDIRFPTQKDLNKSKIKRTIKNKK